MVTKALNKLIVAFPSMQPNFWALLGSELGGKSEAWLQYMLGEALRTDRLTTVYRYGKLCIADFMSIDRELETLTQYQVSALRWPHEPVVIAKVGKKFYYCFESAAKASGYEYEPYVTDAQREHEDAERRRSLTEEELAEIAEEREKFFKKYNVR